MPVACRVHKTDFFPQGASAVFSHPVAENAGASVGGLDLPDVGQMDLFGKNEQQQTLHPDWCDLD